MTSAVEGVRAGGKAANKKQNPTRSCYIAAVVVVSFLLLTCPSSFIFIMVKNDERLASLLGTWTGQSHIKAFSVGHYELLVYFVVHIMPDPMRGYGCSLPPSICSEKENQVCLEHDTDQEAKQECVDMTNATVPWSDGK